MFIDSFKQHFETVADPRQSAKVTYPFFDILFGTLCAVIAGARGWFDIREYYWDTTNGSSSSVCSKQVFLLTTPLLAPFLPSNPSSFRRAFSIGWRLYTP